MPAKLISVDEYLSKRKSCAKDNGTVYKAFKSPRSWNPNERSAQFVMSTESVDRHGDIVVQSGLDIEKFMENPVALLNHRGDSPIGLWSDVKRVTGKPRRTEGKMTLLPEGADPNADRAAAHISFGTMKTASIGFRPKTVEIIRNDKGDWSGYNILESELLECSLVTIPAQAEAIAKAMDEGDAALAKSLIEEVLDNWASHPVTGLVIPKSEFEAKYKAVAAEKTMVIGDDAAEPAEMPVWLCPDPSTWGFTKKINADAARIAPFVPKHSKAVVAYKDRYEFVNAFDSSRTTITKSDMDLMVVAAEEQAAANQACVAAVEKALSDEPARKTISSIVRDLLVKAGLVSKPADDAEPEVEKAEEPNTKDDEPESVADPVVEQNPNDEMRKRLAMAKAKAALALSRSS
jgi:HK97 family phage prohead protease